MMRVWIVPLDSFDVLTADRLAWLDPAEHERAARFYTPLLANRWRVAHVALRGILGEVVGAPPAALRFGRDARGKPFLEGGGPLRFNLSHTADLAAVAVADGTELGVDVEELRPVPEMEGVAATHFAPEEQAALWATAEPSRLTTFYRIWTRKESYVKATGVGIGPALARFAVTADAAPPRLLYANDTPDLGAWTLYELPVPTRYLGAICCAGPPQAMHVTVWRAS